MSTGARPGHIPRVRSGPPPDPNALRRAKDRGEWRHLDPAGRPGDPPPFPLSRPTRRELVVWLDEWKRPQAIAWEANGQQLEVAFYVRAVVVAEKRGASAASMTLVRQMMDSLGLTVPGLRANRWIIDESPAEPARPERSASQQETASRLEVLRGGA